MTRTRWVGLIAMAALLSPLQTPAAEPASPVSAEAQRHMSRDALLQLAKSLEDGGAYPAAAEIYERMAADKPKDATPWRLLSDLYLKIGNAGAAARALDEAVKRAPNDLDVAASRAKMLLLAGDLKGADAAFADVIARQKKPPVATYNAAGVVRDLMGDVTTARSYYARGLDIVPDDPAIKNNLALSFAVTGDYATSIGLLKEGLDVPARAANAKRNLAVVYALSGQTKEAIELSTPKEGEAPLDPRQRFFLESLAKLKPGDRAAAVFLRRLPAGMEYVPPAAVATQTAMVEDAAPGAAEDGPLPKVTVLQPSAAPVRAPTRRVQSPPPPSRSHSDLIVVQESQEAPMKQVEDQGPNMLAAALTERATIRNAPNAPAEPPSAERSAPKPPPQKAKPAETKAAAPAGPVYRLQLGAYPAEALMTAAWADLTKKHGAQLAGLAPTYAAGHIENGKQYFRLYAGSYGDFGAATAACTALSKAGVKCLPIRSTLPVKPLGTN